MSTARRDSPVSRKRPLGPAHASPVLCSGGGVGASSSPKVKRRLFAAGPGSRSTIASAAADAEVDWLRHQRQLILIAGAVASATVVRVATAPVEPHPDLYSSVMGVPGFTEDHLHLNEGRPCGMVFLVMSEPHRTLWIEQILANKQEL